MRPSRLATQQTFSHSDPALPIQISLTLHLRLQIRQTLFRLCHDTLLIRQIPRLHRVRDFSLDAALTLLDPPLLDLSWHKPFRVLPRALSGNADGVRHALFGPLEPHSLEVNAWTAEGKL